MEKSMSSEYDTLSPDLQHAIDMIIKLVRFRHQYCSRQIGEYEVYAYPSPKGVCWGINEPPDGFNIARGVRT